MDSSDHPEGVDEHAHREADDVVLVSHPAVAVEQDGQRNVGAEDVTEEGSDVTPILALVDCEDAQIGMGPRRVSEERKLGSATLPGPTSG